MFDLDKNRVGIPHPGVHPKSAQQAMLAIKEALETLSGGISGEEDRAVRLQDLVELGLIQASANGEWGLTSLTLANGITGGTKYQLATKSSIQAVSSGATGTVVTNWLVASGDKLASVVGASNEQVRVKDAGVYEVTATIEIDLAAASTSGTTVQADMQLSTNDGGSWSNPTGYPVTRCFMDYYATHTSGDSAVLSRILQLPSGGRLRARVMGNRQAVDIDTDSSFQLRLLRKL